MSNNDGPGSSSAPSTSTPPTGAYTRQLHNFFHSKSIQSSRGQHTVAWEESSTDESGSLIWIVKVRVDGAIVSSASGARKNVAKDHASREALIAMEVIDG